MENEKIVVKTKDIEYLMEKFYLKKIEAKNILVENKGNLKKTIENYVF